MNIATPPGCCTSDPCGPGNGTCPDGSLRASSFNADAYEDLPTQDCDDARGTDIWYSCKFNNPPFMGCCAENACANGGCSRSRLVPAKLSENENHRLGFLEPDSSGSTSTAASTSSSTSSSSPKGSENDDGGLGYQRDGSSTRYSCPLPPGGMPEQSPMSNHQASFTLTPTITPYYPSGVSSSELYQQKYSPQASQFVRSQPIDNLSSNGSIAGQNRGYIQTYGNAQTTPVQEMDGMTTAVQELSTGQEYNISQNQSPNLGLGFRSDHWL
ncbi:hypothetical protein MRS44_013171 [Fusarium solani]|uniref:uncharacterized protein n=1 Tax=Fusarium solani TaxID=169388 RepID=UPI0032C3E958|nr:hypothetical protein MRS44_013171 [Fusarium solani]